MADKSLRHPENAPGPWYVDDNCIFCGLCLELALDNMVLSADNDKARVGRQPDTADETAGMEEAMAQCPTESIGNDG